MCRDPAGCDSLPAPICSNSSCVHGGTWQLLMYSAGTNGHIPSAWLPPQILYLLPRSADTQRYTVAGNTDTEEIRLCSLDTPKQSRGIFWAKWLHPYCNSDHIVKLLQFRRNPRWGLSHAWGGRVFKSRCHRKCENWGIKQIQCLSPDPTSYFRDPACRLCKCLTQLIWLCWHFLLPCLPFSANSFQLRHLSPSFHGFVRGNVPSCF